MSPYTPTPMRPFALARPLGQALLLTTLGAALCACSTVPAPNAALSAARSHYNNAQRQAEVASLASQELQAAAAALQLAEQSQAKGESLLVVDHLAYMANQRVTLAEDNAHSRAAQALTASAGAERDRARLSQRTQEADAAQSELLRAQKDNLNQAAQQARSDARLLRRDNQVDDLQLQLRDLNARQTDKGLVVTLSDLLFATGGVQLQGTGGQSVAKLAAFMKHNPERKAAIEGYTDSVGSDAYNQGLSDRRARSVMASLVALGVPAAHLSTQAFGEERPVADNTTAAGRQMNRRVEVVFDVPASDTLAR